jgi:beta-phosphoglucomutase-like phosphatase (HAD superfamily)
MANMSNLQAVIFDLDGTIADTECFHREAWNLTSNTYQLGISGEELFVASLGISSVKTLKQMLPECWNDRISEVAEYKFKTTMDLLEGNEVRLMPGFEETYDRLSENNIKIGICTSAREANIRALLASRGKLPEILQKMEGKIVWKEMTNLGKPSPQPLLLSMNMLGVSVPKFVLYIGDAVADFACAQSAGTGYLHFAADRAHSPEALTGRVKVIDDHRQLLDLLPLANLPDVEL